ncbi:MAG: amidohydrolase family protein [Defluviicoccus sp.]|nr:amidohydrolase family protein [Defluviicoccus sp.]MDE0276600.1 amidohydrolase family protein [Defluviicoccus sp.]
MDTIERGTARTELAELKRTAGTRDVLARAARQARERNFDDYLIVDVDAHHFENQSWSEIVEYVPDPVIREIASSFRVGPNASEIGPGIMQVSSWPANQSVGGRIPHEPGILEPGEPGVQRDVSLVRRAIESFGIDYQVIFPTPMLALGLHPEIEVEIALSRGYNRWVTERILSADDRIKSMLYLPFNDPPACEEIVERYGGTQGVVGFMVTSVRYKPVHHNAYMRLYRMIEERGLTLGFHAGPNWGGDGYVRQLNRFLTMHAISFSLCNMVHLANWVMNGLPERFPDLPVVWIESGIAWLAFMMPRLDNEYLMRSSEAPALKRLPSEYIGEMYYTSQPLERTNLKLLEATCDAFNAPTQMMYSSDWPHWDFDAPSVIFDLPFFDEQAKRNILGLTAKRVFRIED